MRMTKEQLAIMAKPFFKVTNSIWLTTDGHSFYAGYEAKQYAEKNKVECFEFTKEKPNKKAE